MAELAERIRKARSARQISQTELARRAGISRQALGAIEAGLYLPGVSVALKLARELGETVESLFGEPAFGQVDALLAEPARGPGVRNGSGVALGRVGGHVVAIPCAGAQKTLACAGGIVQKLTGARAQIESLRSTSEIASTLLIAGCDPAVSILAEWLGRHHAQVRVASFGCGSRQALDSLVAGQVHVAGTHLRDRRTGQYNREAVRKAFGHRRTLLVGFTRWELGLATAPGNPHAIRGIEDLARPGLTIVNRARGAGARSALDEGMRELGIDPGSVRGYSTEVAGHLEVAEAIAAGRADLGVTVRVAARAYRLGFVPLREERYDLVIPERETHSTPVRALMESLTSTRFAREVASLCGYDTATMGEVLARIG